jgi:3-hydroxybutyryl-CoA dehydrogenase
MTGPMKVTVIGAGTMGHGIAQVAAMAGDRVALHDRDSDALRRAMEKVEANLRKGVELEKVSGDVRDRALEGLSPAPELASALEGAYVVIEAVPERMELKQTLFREAEELAPAEALLATNTSSLSIDALAGALQQPQRLVGLHFFNPVHIMALVEVVHGPRTDPQIRERAVELARRWGKEPIVVRDSPGFASSRLGVALGLEAMRMVEEGVASPQDIDTAMELGYRHPMGPLRLSDLVGLDVRLGIAEYLHRELGQEHFRPPDILRRMVEEGRLGKKSGEGFYSW